MTSFKENIFIKFKKNNTVCNLKIFTAIAFISSLIFVSYQIKFNLRRGWPVRSSVMMSC